MSLDSFFLALQDEVFPGIWSKGVALARDRKAILDSKTTDEVIVRIQTPGKVVSPKVSVWPEEDDAHCDCGAPVEPCIHVVAAVVALKNDWFKAAVESTGAAAPVRLEYRFLDQKGALAFARRIVVPGQNESPLQGSLVGYVGGVESGRLASPLPALTRSDFKVDEVVSRLGAEGSLESSGLLQSSAIRALFEALREASPITLEGKPVGLRPEPLRMKARIEDSGPGVTYQLREPSLSGAEGPRRFSNGVVLEGGLLRPYLLPSRPLLENQNRRFSSPAEMIIFTTRLLPLLEQETDLEVRSTRLPRLERLAPRIWLETFRDPSAPEELEVMPRLVYGEPMIAEVIEGAFELLGQGPHPLLPLRDEAAEQALMRKLQLELHLKPRQRTRLRGGEAVDFLKKSATWRKAGEVEMGFTVKGNLTPALSADRTGLKVRFALTGSTSSSATADPDRVLGAWRQGEKVVPLLEGGWAEVPHSWLAHNADRLEALLATRKPSVAENLQQAEFVLENDGTLSSDLRMIRERLVEFCGIPERKLPADLHAELRPYQRSGVNWLGCLRDLGLGALLADDMGLGKTLQALCVFEGSTLVVAPTSVLPSWEEQLRRFRPGLRLGLYHGAGRRFDSSVDVTLTSYGVLRQDQALLTAEDWQTVVLDEAQQIKNPESQIARIAHQLRGKFKLALTGTPIENRLEDLWSQFQFLQPGLLGSREEFLRSAQDSRRKIRPLILRRMKREVAPELPEKTETVLYSTLTEVERSAYLSVLAATREKVVQELQAGGSVMGALEALLRLRQICADPALVPGLGLAQVDRDASAAMGWSSKLGLLRETLEESLELGHSVLIFSQWTGLLDRVEGVLKSLSTVFCRLDGSTRNREQVIRDFQDPSGPRVMMLSLKAGGVGITLTKADHVIILDPWWNPAVEDQAVDRAHRIGQSQPVLVQRLVAKDTVEEKILALKSRKRELAESILGRVESETPRGQEFTREELLELLT